MMEGALYLLPVTLGETPVENVLPVYNKAVSYTHLDVYKRQPMPFCSCRMTG